MDPVRYMCTPCTVSVAPMNFPDGQHWLACFSGRSDQTANPAASLAPPVKLTGIPGMLAPWNFIGAAALLLWKQRRCQIKTRRRRRRLIRNCERCLRRRPRPRLRARPGLSRRADPVLCRIGQEGEREGKEAPKSAISPLLIQPKRIPGHLSVGCRIPERR